jgi:hypothetical protein
MVEIVIEPIVQLIQLLASVVLAIFTGVLAWATLEYVDASESQVEAESKPYLKPATNIEEGGIQHFVLENIGNGTAHNVQANWKIENLEDSERSFHAPIMRPGERANFNFPISDDGDPLLNADELEAAFEDRGVQGVMTVDIEYDDALENNWGPTRDRIDIVDQLRKRLNPDIFYMDNMDDAII